MYRPQMVGSVSPPADMIDAARRSLDAEGFEELMRETGGRAPTAKELVAKVEARRNAS
jgi:hypothetical protein